MIDQQEDVQTRSELDAVMTRVRDAISRRRDRGAVDVPPPISLDGIIRRQAELNDVVVRAIETFASQIAALKNAPSPAPRPVAVIGEQRVAALEQRMAGLEQMLRDIEESREAEAAAQHDDAVDSLGELRRELAALSASVDAATARRSRADLERSRRIAAIEARLDAWREPLATIEARLVATVESFLTETTAAQASLGARVGDGAAALATLDQTVAGLAARLQECADGISALRGSVSNVANDLEARLSETSEQAAEARRRADEADRTAGFTEEKVLARLDEMRMRVLRTEREMRRNRSGDALPQVAATPASSPVPPSFDYFMFEHRFRGTGDDIRRRQQKYVELFAGRQNVLDLGCGRGEFLQVALRQGINVRGVDHSEDMVAFGRDQGLPVVQGDLFEHLAALPEGSLDGLFCAQVIEHLGPEDVMRLVHLVATRLRPGSPVVFETVNPHCALALGNFFLDPTHVRPVPPLMLRFLLEQSLFTVNALRFSSPVPGHSGPESIDALDPLPDAAHAYQDYAALAVRT